MNQDQVLEIARTYGPSFLAICGAILSFILAAMSALVSLAWKAHNRRMAGMARAIDLLAESLDKYEKNGQKDMSKVWEATLGLRTDLQLSIYRSDAIKSSLLKVEGALGVQVTRVDTYVERMGRVDSKLDRIFAYIDAPKRASEL
jgi:hypothetical protein